MNFSGVGRILVLGGHLATKGYHAPPAAGPGDEGPRMVAKFKILKRFKVLENESTFQKYQHFSCPKNPFFLRKLSINGTDFPRNSEFFRKIKIKISIFMMHINPEVFPVDSIIKVRKPFLKKLQVSG